MSIKKQILSSQRFWAIKSGLSPDEKGYLATYEDNLYQPMNDVTRASFDQGSGSELKDTPKSPAKMRALHSSSALAVNIFDHWVGIENSDLVKALGLECSGPSSIRFEAQYPTGLPGNPPNLDVAIELPDGDVLAIESKFTEWLTPKPESKAPFKDKYFPEGVGLWESVSLPSCQKLAEEMRSRAVSFKYLDAAQLLKHALGLAVCLGDRFRLYYTYFDADCPAGDIHRKEIEQFANAVDETLGFRAISYQALYRKFDQNNLGSDTYRAYLFSRYFTQ